jgi:NADP-dependent aldehyde dehydrogenase
MVVVVKDFEEMLNVARSLEGNLTGCIYSSTQGTDDTCYQHLAAVLTPKVGRLLNDKVPTGVAVTEAMQHGGPFPATGHPGFSSVGGMAALRRFTALRCYDNVREERLPAALRSDNPLNLWRRVDGGWVRG